MLDMRQTKTKRQNFYKKMEHYFLILLWDEVDVTLGTHSQPLLRLICKPLSIFPLFQNTEIRN